MIRLIGITDEITADRVIASTAEPALKGLTIVKCNGLAALLVPVVKAGWFDTNSRASLVRRLGDDQKRLEALIGLGPLVPAVNEGLLDNHADAEDLLLSSADALTETLRDYGTLVQFQINIDWKPEAVLQAHAADPELRAILVDDRAERGAALAAFMAGLRKRLADSFCEKAAGAAREIVLLPGSGEGNVVNIVALIDRAEEARLDRAVEAIDAEVPDALAIRYTGPLPPVSFAGLDVKKSSAGDITAARHLLGLDERSSLAMIRDAYVTQARAIHPDTAAPSENVAPDLTELKEAYLLLSRVNGRKTGNGRLPPLVSIRREGEVARRA
jgi:hypothetical protein